MTDDGGVVGLDVGPVTEWILADDRSMRGPLSFRRIGRGQSNLTFLVTGAGDGPRRILRRPPLGQLLASAHDVEREHRILSAIGPTPVPAPAVVAFSQDPEITDVPLLLMEYVDGLVIDEPVVAERLSTGIRNNIGHSLARTLGVIHDVNLEQCGLIDLASHKPFAERQLKRWRRQWAASKTRELPAVEDLADRLEAAMPEQTELTLVHGDFHLLNMIVNPDDGSIRAVLDWELCTLGEPLADLGGLLAYWSQPGDGVDVALFVASTLPGFPTREELVATYAQTTGRDVRDVGFWHALALWRIAIIYEGILRRTIDDPRNISESGAPDSEIVKVLITRAEAVAAEAGI